MCVRAFRFMQDHYSPAQEFAFPNVRRSIAWHCCSTSAPCLGDHANTSETQLPARTAVSPALSRAAVSATVARPLLSAFWSPAGMRHGKEGTYPRSCQLGKTAVAWVSGRNRQEAQTFHNLCER